MAEKKRILVVDDEADQRTWLTTLLQDNGYETVEAEDGEAGLAQAGNGVDLITLDISMDNESGLGMFRKLQGAPETASIPVVMITGVAREFKQFVERARQVRNPDAYFEKPVDRQALLRKIEELLG